MVVKSKFPILEGFNQRQDKENRLLVFWAGRKTSVHRKGVGIPRLFFTLLRLEYNSLWQKKI